MFGKKEKSQETGDVRILMLKDAQKNLREYLNMLQPIHDRIIENEQWYKSRHWDYIRNAKFQDDPEPTTAFVLASVENKHSDAMDHYPMPIFLPRDPKDKETAKMLQKIIPTELAWNDFYDVYYRAYYDKLKTGCAIYAVLFDPEGNDGIGSAVVSNVDPLSFICNPRVSHIDQSKWVFIPSILSKEQFETLYPEADTKKAGRLFEPKKYSTTPNEPTTQDDFMVIDGYYLKKDVETGAICVHFMQFAGDEILYRSEDEEIYAETGYYECDGYPFVLDQLYFEKENIFSFGLIDVIKSPQVYIDKLDQIILANTFAHSRKRHFVREAAGVNVTQFLDPSQPLVTCNNINEEFIREIKVEPTDASVFNHRHNKIEELKETSSANEFARGETSGGVTAAQAIVALQKASGKTSRSMIAKTYDVFSNIIYFYVEHMRQFYDESRMYRIEDKSNPEGYDFAPFNNSGMKPQMMQLVSTETPQYRRPMFDIEIVAQRRDPYSQIADNEMAKELFNLGAFNPQRYLESEVLMTILEFERKEEVMALLKKNANIQQMLQMGAQAQEENQKMKMIIQKLTGANLGLPMDPQPAQ